MHSQHFAGTVILNEVNDLVRSEYCLPGRHEMFGFAKPNVLLSLLNFN